MFFASSWTIGVSLDSANKDVCTSLNLVAEKGHVYFVRELLNNGASVKLQIKEVTHLSTYQFQTVT